MSLRRPSIHAELERLVAAALRIDRTPSAARARAERGSTARRLKQVATADSTIHCEPPSLSGVVVPPYGSIPMPQ